MHTTLIADFEPGDSENIEQGETRPGSGNLTDDGSTHDVSVPYVDLVGGAGYDKLANDLGEVGVILVDAPLVPAAVGSGFAPVTASALVPVIGKTDQEVGVRYGRDAPTGSA